MTPAAISRNVANLERGLGGRLFQRISRNLTLTEDSERFLASVSDGVQSIQSAIAHVTVQAGKPAGVLKVSMPSTFGQDYLMQMLPAFLARYPDVQLDLGFENRQVDLIGEGFDAAIGGGMELPAGIVARRLAPLHVVAVASPDYLRGCPSPREPQELAALDGLSMRSALTGRVRVWRMRNSEGVETTLEHRARIVANDPEALCRAALMALGVAMIAVPYVERHLESGALLRLSPTGTPTLAPYPSISPARNCCPAKTRAFVDHVIAGFREQNLARRFSAEG